MIAALLAMFTCGRLNSNATRLYELALGALTRTAYINKDRIARMQAPNMVTPPRLSYNDSIADDKPNPLSRSDKNSSNIDAAATVAIAVKSVLRVC